MEINKPVVGQILYSLNIGNAARNREQVLTPVVVKRVGRKYFTVGIKGTIYADKQYHTENWRQKTDYSPVSALYTSVEQYEDESECSKISKEIYCAFEYGRNRLNLPLSVLRQIKSLIISD